MNWLNRNKLIDTEKKLVVVRGKGHEGWGKGEGIKKYKFSVTNKSQGCNTQHNE